VAYLTYGFGREALGIGKYGWYVVNELRKLGVHIDVFTTRLHLKSVGPPLFYIKNLSLKLKDYDLVSMPERLKTLIQNILST